MECLLLTREKNVDVVVDTGKPLLLDNYVSHTCGFVCLVVAVLGIIIGCVRWVSHAEMAGIPYTLVRKRCRGRKLLSLEHNDILSQKNDNVVRSNTAKGRTQHRRPSIQNNHRVSEKSVSSGHQFPIDPGGTDDPSCDDMEPAQLFQGYSLQGL